MKRLLLLGGGHAHVRVLDLLARQPLAGWEVVLITPQPRMLYSGMLPGWVAGHYDLAQCAIDLEPLAAAAGVRLVIDEARALDAGARCVQSLWHGRFDADTISLDVGSACAQDGIDGAARHAVPVRPIPAFVASWESLQQRLGSGCAPLDLVVVGAGPGGVELAFGARQRALREGWSSLNVHLVGSDAMPLANAPAPVQQRLLTLLRQRAIRWHGGQAVAAITPDAVRLRSGEAIHVDAAWLVTGPAAHPWLATSGLALDARGFVRVQPNLQSTSHPRVFAAGDAASHEGEVPKSGVYAVRSGAVLARNLVAHARGEALRPWRPPARALYLLSTADRRAIALWGRWHAEARWLWWLKDRIDTGFIARRAV